MRLSVSQQSRYINVVVLISPIVVITNHCALWCVKSISSKIRDLDSTPPFIIDIGLATEEGKFWHNSSRIRQLTWISYFVIWLKIHRMVNFQI